MTTEYVCCSNIIAIAYSQSLKGSLAGQTLARGESLILLLTCQEFLGMSSGFNGCDVHVQLPFNTLVCVP